MKCRDKPIIIIIKHTTWSIILLENLNNFQLNFIFIKVCNLQKSWSNYISFYEIQQNEATKTELETV